MRFLKLSALLAVLLFSAVMLLGVFSLRALPSGGGAAPGATLNGDVNCDGKVDISDAIHTLRFLFTGGPAPCAIAQETGIQDVLEQIKGLRTELAAKWPPKPEDFIAVATMGKDERDNDAYQVPEGKTFVLMNLTVAEGNGSSEIWEVAGGKSTLKWPKTRVPFESAIGLRFASGSTVLLKLDDPSHGCSPVPCGEVSYSFAGYLVDG